MKSPDVKAEHQAARERVQKLTVIGLRPDLTPEQREAVRNAEESTRAEVKLRRKALDHEEQQPLPSASEPSLPPDPTIPSIARNPSLSTKPATSGSTTSTPPTTYTKSSPRRRSGTAASP